MPVALRPFASQLRGPEFFAIMSSGMAAVAGSTLAGYASLGVRMEYLLAASFMAIPGGLLFAKLICPSREPSTIQVDQLHFEERPRRMPSTRPRRAPPSAFASRSTSVRC
jgi:CNT family concentrative nucleoside transporter